MRCMGSYVWLLVTLFFGLEILPRFSSTITPVSLYIPPVLSFPEEPVRCIGCLDWPFLVVSKRAVLVDSLPFPVLSLFLDS